jgi:hypothetical protein
VEIGACHGWRIVHAVAHHCHIAVA